MTSMKKLEKGAVVAVSQIMTFKEVTMPLQRNYGFYKSISSFLTISMSTGSKGF